MTRPSDEMLMAFADGELADDQRAAIERYLAADAEARALVEAMRHSRQLAADAFAHPVDDAQSRRLAERILAAPLPDKVNVTQLRPRRLPTAAMPIRPLMAMAASLVLVAGSCLGYLLGRQSMQTMQPPSSIAVGPVPPASMLAQLLETRPSGSTADSSPGSSRLTVAATFRDRHARPCREIEVLAPGSTDRAIAIAIACRAPSGTWSVEGAAQVMAWEPGSNQYKPSGASEKDALDGLISLLGVGRALDTAQERDLISRGWSGRE